MASKIFASASNASLKRLTQCLHHRFECLKDSRLISLPVYLFAKRAKRTGQLVSLLSLNQVTKKLCDLQDFFRCSRCPAKARVCNISRTIIYEVSSWRAAGQGFKQTKRPSVKTFLHFRLNSTTVSCSTSHCLTAGHLFRLEPWPAAGHRATAYYLTYISNSLANEGFGSKFLGLRTNRW